MNAPVSRLLVELGEVADFVNGYAFKPEDWSADGLPIIRIQNLTGTGREYNRTKLDVPEKFRVNKGDLLVSWSASLGVFEWDGPEAVVNQHIFKVVPNLKKVELAYLRHAIDASIHEMERFTHGSTMKHINRREFLEHQIPLPPLDEQRRIAAILDKADALRRKRKRAIELLKSHSHAVFAHFFPANEHNSNVVEVGDITTCIVPGRDKPRSFTGSIPWVTTSELAHLGYTTRDRATAGLTEGEVAEVKAKIVPANSVLMTCVGDLGVVSIAQHPMVINQQLHSFQCSERVTPEYLMYALSYQKGFMYRRATQTTLPYMNKTVCNSVPIQLPCLETQIQFSRCIRQVTNRLSAMLLAERAKEKLFSSLQHRAFSGQL